MLLSLSIPTAKYFETKNHYFFLQKKGTFLKIRVSSSEQKFEQISVDTNNFALCFVWLQPQKMPQRVLINFWIRNKGTGASKIADFL